MKVVLHETDGENTRDVEIEGTLTEVLVVLEAIDDDGDIEKSRKAQIEELIAMFENQTAVDAFGEKVNIVEYTVDRAADGTRHNFVFSNGDDLILRAEND